MLYLLIQIVTTPFTTTNTHQVKMDGDGISALRVVINHFLNDKRNKLHYDSAELAQLKIDAPILFLGGADIGNRKTGRFVTAHLHDKTELCTLMYKGRSDDGKFMFEAIKEEDGRRVLHPEFSKHYMITWGLVPSPFDIGDRVVPQDNHDGPVGAIGTVNELNFCGIPGLVYVKPDPPYRLVDGRTWIGHTGYAKRFKLAE